MSEFTRHKQHRMKQLTALFNGILRGENPGELVRQNQSIIDSCIPSDVIALMDQLVLMEVPMENLKRGVNKLLNLLHKTLKNHPYYPPAKNSFLGALVENNRLMDEKLQALRPKIRKINEEPQNQELKSEMLKSFQELEKFRQHYQIKENVLFPLIEKNVPDYRCLAIMWSFHDDIKRNMKAAIEQLQANFNLKAFNRIVGDLFFNSYAIKFREERILYPLVEEVIEESTLNALFTESMEIGFPFYQPQIVSAPHEQKNLELGELDLGTGALKMEQIKLLFNHLPVDITFADENNIVRYFSAPKKRIFPRTTAIIGRDVHNCHPPESVHVVEKIVEAFRKGEKDTASFWINLKESRVLIQYFAVRDPKGNYKGVVEVSQEISEIQNLVGEKRLLDWEA